MKSASPALVVQLQAEQRRFLTFLTPRVGSVEVARDLLQVALLRAVESGHTLREGERATAWFFQLLRNVVVDHLRQSASEARTLEAAARELPAAATRELERHVCACVEGLSVTVKPEYAEAVRRVDLGGLTPSEYAAEAGISPGNARVRLHRARAALAERLLEMCGVCCQQGCEVCPCEQPGGAV